MSAIKRYWEDYAEGCFIDVVEWHSKKDYSEELKRHFNKAYKAMDNVPFSKHSAEFFDECYELVPIRENQYGDFLLFVIGFSYKYLNWVYTHCAGLDNFLFDNEEFREVVCDAAKAYFEALSAADTENAYEIIAMVDICFSNCIDGRLD